MGAILATPVMPALPSPAAITALGAAAKTGHPLAGGASVDPKSKARAAAVDFEAVFLNSMFKQMFTAAEGDGPLGGGPAVGVWRSFLTDEYAKNFAKAGGIGIADHVYHTLLGQQEAAGAAAGTRAP
jgi:Rod binding domain-containing protein